jgi:subtilisin-like proprotein convertase family protein
MSKRKLLPVVLLLLALLVSSLSVAASTGTAAQPLAYTVAIPQSEAAEAAALGLNPQLAYDYGSFQWLLLNLDDFSRLAASGLRFEHQADAGIVQITGHRFDPLADGEPALPAGQRASGSGPGFYLVQFYGPTNDAWLSGLAGAGLDVLQYYPHFTYLVWGTEAQVAVAARSENVRWSGAVHPAYKMNSDLVERSGRVSNVDIFFYNDGDVTGTLAAVEALGANILQSFPAQPDQKFFDAIVELDVAAFDALAQLDTVLWFGYASPEPILEDEMSSQIVAGNYVAGVPFTGYFAHLANLGFDGSGVIWGIIDTGVDYNHPDLGPRIVAGYNYPGACNTGNPGEDCPNGGHGTHVAGIVGGDATAGFADPNGFLYGLGIAPGYSIFASNSLSASAWPPTGGWQEHSKRAVLGGAIGGNNSWTTGEGTNHGYQASERTHDIMVLDGNFDTTDVAEPFIEVFSAGNSGPNPSTLTAPKEAKNLIVTASSRNYRVGSIDTISSFSSRGPAVDGRWVPTVAAPGEQIASTRNDTGGVCATAIAGTNNMYAYCSGTSMAAPQVSGAITLATEWWRTFNAGANPSSAMAKALMVNGAVDMGTADIPNIHEGWGRINVTNVISPSAMTEYYDAPMVFGNSGESWTLNVGIADPSQPLKVTLAWADAPGAVGANPALVNNLNLTVNVGGTDYLGNVFSGGWSTTGGTADNINNLENVFVQNPSGSVAITVDAVNIAGDAVLYNADPTDQSFALVCYNCALFPDFSLGVTPSSLDVCAPSNAVYTVNVGSILGYTDPVTLNAGGNPAGTTTNFSVNPVIPPGSSTLTIGNTGAASAGSYDIDVVGVAPTSTHTTTVWLNLYTATPAAPTLVSPPNGATGVNTSAVLTWNAAANATGYTVEVASDAAFTNIVYSNTVAGTSDTATGLNVLTQYFWRVRANNVCGSGVNSAVWSFTTAALYCNSTPISIPSSGPGSPYPSNIAVAGSGSSVVDVNVHLVGLSHTWPDDIDILVVGPQGQNLIIMSDAGGSNDLVNVDLIFDDAAASQLPDSSQITAGTYKPTNYGAGDTFPAPAPAPSSATTLSTFDGTNPNGTWSLYVVDDTGSDSGNLAGGWCLEVGTTGAVNTPPTITTAGITTPIDEDDTATLSGTFTDPDAGDTFTLTVDWGDGSAPEVFNYPAGTTSFSESHQYLDDDPTGTPSDVLDVDLLLEDDAGGSDSDTVQVTVNNVDPVVNAGSNISVVLGNPAAFNGSFTDVGTLDSHTIEWDFGDGATASGSLTPTHTYTATGVYSVTLTVTDDDTGVGSDSLTVMMVDEYTIYLPVIFLDAPTAQPAPAAPLSAAPFGAGLLVLPAAVLGLIPLWRWRK